MFLSSRCHTVPANDNVLHLAELGRSRRFSTGYSRVFVIIVGHNRILSVWGKAVTAGKYNLAYSERL
jgi:hypothetical protein